MPENDKPGHTINAKTTDHKPREREKKTVTNKPATDNKEPKKKESENDPKPKYLYGGH